MKQWIFSVVMMVGGIEGHASPPSPVPLSLASPLQSDMVVQAGRPFTVWGHATAGQSVQINADWMAGSVSVVAAADNAFMGIIDVPPAAPGDFHPHSLTVRSGNDSLSLTNVLIGEVWFCSGQSNMQFSMKTVLDSTAEIAAAQYPSLRLLNADLNFSAEPLETFSGKWVACTPQTVRNFSAVGYYFGRRLLQKLQVPIGIIFSGIGASAAQAYVPQSVLASDTLLNRVYLQPYLSSPKSKEIINGGFSFEKVTRPFLLYNAMIHPFRHLSISGFCWYQGESNRMERNSYTRLTQAMIKSWRDSAGQGNLPFYYVQVAPYFYDKPDSTLADYAFFREAQERIATLDHTAMVITMDVGEGKNLHPLDKKPVGERLAATALNRIYDQDVVYRGPAYRSIEIKGKEAIIRFEPGTVTGGLITRDGQPPAYFTLAGDDHLFFAATAVIEGNDIHVRCDHVKKPIAVRYAFTNYPVTNLENGAGWPVVPFRTDNWPE